MTIEIYNGSVWCDITPYIKYQGVTFSRQDVEAPDAGRTIDGLMHRARIAVKERMDLETVPLDNEQAQYIQALLYPPTFSVRVTPYPITNTAKTMTMYSNNAKTSYVIHRENGADILTLSFPLVEV